MLNAVVTLVGLTTAGPPQVVEAPPPESLLLFVASWCAPCHAELRALDAIAAAVTPVDVQVVPIDATAATERMLVRTAHARTLRLPPARALASMRAWTGGAPGLPTAVMTDDAGRPCAVSRRPLDAAAARAMRARCAP